MADALDDRAFVLDELHKAYHHYLKVRRLRCFLGGWGESHTLVILI